MHLIYPSDPFNRQRPDEEYCLEFDAINAAGLACSLFSLEDFQAGIFRPRPIVELGTTVIYRGWMLGIDDYAKLADAIQTAGAKPLSSTTDYRRCHHLPGWYEACRKWTPETVFLQRDSDFRLALAELNWPAYFVKDYVKSLTTARGSMATNAEEVAELVSLLEKFRETIEGGVCVRRFESLLPETEERYFVCNSIPCSRDGVVPDLVRQVAAVIDCPFFSVDTVVSATGDLRLIELGDGQVSDRKRWPAEIFAAMLKTHFA